MSDSEKIRTNLHRKIVGMFDKVQATVDTINGPQWDIVVFQDSGWTVADLIRHMISVEEIIQSYIEQIVSGGEGATPEFDLDKWNAAQVKKLRIHPPESLLPMFVGVHQAGLDLLGRVPDDAWDKQGYYPHELIGTIAVKGWFKMIAVHNRIHLNDIQKALEHE